MKRLLNPRCELCGHFVSWGADNATYYGSAHDYEPPDPHYFCPKCAEQCKQEHLERGVPYQAYWLEPEWNREVANILGFVKEGYKWVKIKESLEIVATNIENQNNIEKSST